MKKILTVLILTCSIGLSLPYWGPEDFEKAKVYPRGKSVMQYEVRHLRGEWQKWSYIHELCQTAAFVASMQVSDSLDPEFGGIIEGEDELNIVQTDNTQEAIWVWCRYYEITSDTTYFVNLRRAWIYVMNYPAYNEEGTGSDYYRVWNCGLALFAESKYRNVFNDSTYYSYADTCAKYMLHHPLPFDDPNPTYKQLHPKVTSLAAGMLYQYGKEINNQTFLDTALLYGGRVKDWIETDPSTNINDEVWAMSGGTAVWGLCRSIFDADTSTGIIWLNTYLPYMKYFQPTGNWNNSWNIWYANAYNYSARITQNGTYVVYHHSLTDSLLIQDYDDDGGVPPTRGWNQNRDHSWVSTYMVFMGFEGLMDSIRNIDAGVNAFYAIGPRDFHLVGDTVYLAIRAANFGFLALSNVYFAIDGPYFADTTVDLPIGYEDTISFASPWIPSDTGFYDFVAYSDYSGDERIDNDTLNTTLFIRPLRLAGGMLIDVNTNLGVYAKIYFQFIDDSGSVYFDSTETDSTTGIFNIYLIDSLYRGFFNTEIPFPDLEIEDIYVTPDSISPMYYYFDYADLLIINRDNEARYAEYFEKPLDTLSITYKTWAPVNQGLFPMSRIDEFNYNTVIWFTGNACTNNVTLSEQESLMVFLDNGGQLFMTGQNIGEEIHGSQFFTNYLHAQLISDSIGALYCYPDTLDQLGQNIKKLFTTGTQGAANQYSRDVIVSDGNSFQFLYYNTGLSECAGIWFNDPINNYQIVYCAFGIEAIHKRPDHMSRTEFLAEILDWFGVLEIQEYGYQKSNAPLFSVYPNPAYNRVNVYFSNNVASSKASIDVFDISGRQINTLSKEKSVDKLVWDLKDMHGRRIPNGVYFVEVQIEQRSEIKKAIILH
jgi:hypothetical protein